MNLWNSKYIRTGEDVFYKGNSPVLLFPVEDEIMNGNGLLTIKEASKKYKIHQTTLYKAIQEGRIEVNSTSKGKRKIKVVKALDIENFLDQSVIRSRIEVESTYNRSVIEVDSTSGIPITKNEHSPIIETNSTYNRSVIEVDSTSNESVINLDSISNLIQKSIDSYFETKQTQLMKPIEEQAIYRLGGLEKENLFLRQKVETLIQELEQYKALPWQIEERDEEIKSLEAKLKEEKEELLKKVEQQTKELEEYKPLPAQLVDTTQKLQEKEEQIKNLESMLKKEKDDMELRLLREKEAMNEQEARRKAEFEQALKQAEEEKKQIAEVWKKELEEARKPWWKFW